MNAKAITQDSLPIYPCWLYFEGKLWCAPGWHHIDGASYYEPIAQRLLDYGWTHYLPDQAVEPTDIPGSKEAQDKARDDKAMEIAEELYRWMADDLKNHEGADFLPANVCCDYGGMRLFINGMAKRIGKHISDQPTR